MSHAPHQCGEVDRGELFQYLAVFPGIEPDQESPDGRFQGVLPMPIAGIVPALRGTIVL